MKQLRGQHTSFEVERARDTLMDAALSILFVEDSESDVLLTIRLLRREGYAPNFERVDTPEGLRAALTEQEWDLVITDHNMPFLDSVSVISQAGR